MTRCRLCLPFELAIHAVSVGDETLPAPVIACTAQAVTVEDIHRVANEVFVEENCSKLLYKQMEQE